MRLVLAALVAVSVSGCPATVMCIRSVRCVAACGDTPIEVGCSACPSGTFDDLACRDGGTTDAGSADAGSSDAP
jgi:hypothetical protein